MMENFEWTYHNPEPSSSGGYHYDGIYEAEVEGNYGAYENQSYDKDAVPLPKELTDMFLSNECKLCQVRWVGGEISITHYSGKKHQKQVSKYMQDNYDIVGSQTKYRNKFPPVHCDICNVELTSEIVYIQHLNGKVHKKNMEKRQFVPKEPVMDDVVDFMFSLPRPPTPPDMRTIWCKICHVPTNTKVQLQLHRQGRQHQRKKAKLMEEAQENEEEWYDDDEEEEENGDHEEEEYEEQGGEEHQRESQNLTRNHSTDEAGSHQEADNFVSTENPQDQPLIFDPRPPEERGHFHQLPELVGSTSTDDKNDENNPTPQIAGPESPDKTTNNSNESNEEEVRSGMTSKNPKGRGVGQYLGCFEPETIRNTDQSTSTNGKRRDVTNTATDKKPYSHSETTCEQPKVKSIVVKVTSDRGSSRGSQHTDLHSSPNRTRGRQKRPFSRESPKRGRCGHKSPSSTRKSYRNPNVDYHRRKSTSPSSSSSSFGSPKKKRGKRSFIDHRQGRHAGFYQEWHEPKWQKFNWRGNYYFSRQGPHRFNSKEGNDGFWQNFRDRPRRNYQNWQHNMPSRGWNRFNNEERYGRRADGQYFDYYEINRPEHRKSQTDERGNSRRELSPKVTKGTNGKIKSSRTSKRSNTLSSAPSRSSNSSSRSSIRTSKQTLRKERRVSATSRKSHSRSSSISSRSSKSSSRSSTKTSEQIPSKRRRVSATSRKRKRRSRSSSASSRSSSRSSRSSTKTSEQAFRKGRRVSTTSRKRKRRSSSASS